MGPKFTCEERGSAARMEGAAPGGKAGGLGRETTVGGGRKGIFVLAVVLSALLPFRSGDADGHRPITWRREMLGKLVPERKPSSGSQDYLRRPTSSYINTKNVSSQIQTRLPLPSLSTLALPPSPSPTPTAAVTAPESCPQHPPPPLPQTRQRPRTTQPKLLLLGSNHHQSLLPPTSLP